MQVPSLVSSCLIRLPFSQVKELYFSEAFFFPENIWADKAHHDFSIPCSFFDRYKGGEFSSFRQIFPFERYLELSNSKTLSNSPDEIFHLYEDSIGLKEAIMRNDDNSIEFYFDRISFDAWIVFFDQLKSTSPQILFPREGFNIFYKTLQKLSSLITNGIKCDDLCYYFYRQNMHRFDNFIFLNHKFSSETMTVDEILRGNGQFYFKVIVLIAMVKKGNREALEYLLNQFDGLGVHRARVCWSVLQSGKFELFELFRPFFSKIEFPHHMTIVNIVRLFRMAAYGGNLQILRELTQISKFDYVEKFQRDKLILGKIIRSTVRGFFFHRNLFATYQILSQFSIPWKTFKKYKPKLSGVPIDILDLFYHKNSFRLPYHKIQYLFWALLDNLGYLNVVSYCLLRLNELISEPAFPVCLYHSNFEYKLEEMLSLTPLSVSMVNSYIEKWKILFPPEQFDL